MHSEPFKDVERALRELSRLRLIIRSLPEPVAIFDTEGRITFANPAMRRFVGPYEKDANTMATVRRLKARHRDNTPLSEEDLPWVRPMRGQPITDEVVCYDDEQGQMRYLQYSAAPMREDGKITGIVAVGRDITKLEYARQEAAERQSMLESILSSMADGLIFFDREGRIIRMNDIAARVLEFEERQRRGTMWERVNAIILETPQGKPVPREDMPFYRALHGEIVRNVPLVAKCREGGTHHLLFSAAPMRRQDGEIRGVVVTFSDISLLHEIDMERETFIHTISHDLRSPLAAVRGFAHMLKDDLQAQHVNGETMQFLNLLESNAVKMSNMISDLVDSARLESGRVPIRKQRLDLYPYLHGVLGRSPTAIDIRRIRLNIPADLPPVCGDPDRLDRVMLNLLSNALKFSEPDTDVIVSVQAQEHDVLVAIQDFGMGISPQDIPHLFSRYHVAKMTKSAESVGLGLYITRLLVEAHDGHIWVDSELNRGSTFYFTLRRVDKENGSSCNGSHARKR